MHYYDFINEVSRGWIIRPFCSCISHDWKSPSPLKLKSSERNLISNFVCVWGEMSLARRHIPYISFNCFAFLYVHWLLYSSSVGLMDCILIASEFRPRMFVISPHHTTLSAFHWTTHKIKAQGTSYHAGYFLAGYGYFPYPDVTGKVYKHPDIRKFNLLSWHWFCVTWKSKFRRP